MSDALRAAYGGFRDKLLSYEELCEQLRAWAHAFPKLVKLSSLGPTPEGRELWLVTIGPEPERTRPALWIDANMHASELCGSNVALQVAEDMLRLHLGENPETLAAEGLPPALHDTLRGILVYIMPRVSPDGAEEVLTRGRYVRSTPRDSRPTRTSRWKAQDVDGDGLALLMRRLDEGGDFIESSEMPGVMLPRRPEDPGPYYRIYPEGVVDDFDGFHLPDASEVVDDEIDLNRNFPYNWKGSHTQAGAGMHPLSAPESQAICEFASKHPNIFAWVNLHTFGGVFIRPLGDRPDSKMHPLDLGMYQQLESWARDFTGYPTVSSFEEFTYEPDTPIYGDLRDWAYHERGALSVVVELWDLFEQVGLPRKKRFVDRYAQLDREDILAIARWDQSENAGRVFCGWQAATHEQLGAVEVGGVDPRFGLWNPPESHLAEMGRRHSRCFLHLASLGPRLRVVELDRKVLGDECQRIDLAVENIGYMPTNFTGSAVDLEHAEPILATAHSESLELVSGPGHDSQVRRHLAGWGRGYHNSKAAPFFSRSEGSSNRLALSYVVKGEGILKLRVGSCQMGWQETDIIVEATR